MSHYNNETSLEELGLQMDYAKPKYYVSVQDKQLKKQMKKEKEAINRVKIRIQENKIKEGLESESSFNEAVTVIQTNQVQTTGKSGDYGYQNMKEHESGQQLLQNSTLKESTHKYNQLKGEHQVNFSKAVEAEGSCQVEEVNIGSNLSTKRAEESSKETTGELGVPVEVTVGGQLSDSKSFNNGMMIDTGSDQHRMDTDTNQIQSPKRIYLVGKYKDYRKLVGVEQIKAHSGAADLNMSQKRRKTMSMTMAPPTEQLTLNKSNKRGAQVNEAIKEIIFNLEKYDKRNQNRNTKKFNQTYQGSNFKQRGRNADARRQYLSETSRKSGAASQTSPKHTFLPRLAKQKVLDKFIDMSTADVFPNQMTNYKTGSTQINLANRHQHMLSALKSGVPMNYGKTDFSQMPHDPNHMISIKFARGSTHQNTMQEYNSYHNLDVTNSGQDQSGLHSGMSQTQNDLTLSLPQMGPSFNFYKFKGAQDLLKNKFRETTNDVKSVDNVLQQKWGEYARSTDKYGHARKQIRETDSMFEDHPVTGQVQTMEKNDNDPTSQNSESQIIGHDISQLQRTMDMIEQQNRNPTNQHSPNHVVNPAVPDLNVPPHIQERSNQQTLKKKQTHQSSKPYVPKFVRDEQKEKSEQRQSLNKYKWRKNSGDEDLLTIFLQSVLEKYNGDKEKTYRHIEDLRKRGALQQISNADKFDLREMITDRRQFINQLNTQFGGANVNDLISMQIDEFKVKLQ